ncbi:hypothetical protein [Vannielia sp. SX4]|uniref:hypothetical protein n=1 Tax=Vannielia sp. SX4 TaxID=3463852 RepID=UPI00405952E1
MSEGPQPGEVWDYPYLWARQADHGETEGRKPRPCAVAVLVRLQSGQTAILFLAITSQRPASDRRAVEVPETERRRAGLSTDQPLWIILDEHNADRLETSFNLHPEARIGAFSPRYFTQIKQAFLTAMKQRHSRSVRRDDQ